RKSNGIGDVPAIRADARPHLAPVAVDERNAEIWKAAFLQSPRVAKIVFRARAPDRSPRLAVDVELLVAFAKPLRAAAPRPHPGADIVALTLDFRDKIITAGFFGEFLPVLRAKVRCVRRQFLLRVIHVVIQGAETLGALIRERDLS